jgi:hypothetical protein
LALKDVMLYRPEDIVDTVVEICEASDAHRTTVVEGRVTVQLRGEVAERGLGEALRSFGHVERLSVVRDEGSHTADFKVHLTRELRAGRETYRAGEVLICESKTGTRQYILSEIRDPESHARRQMRETVARENADGAICFVPMECQNDRILIDRIKATMRENSAELRTTVLMSGAHEGSIRSAIRLAEERVSSG